MAKGSIYIVICTVNKRVYIGKTSRAASSRFSSHKTQLRHNKHHSPLLQQDWNLYGEKAFTFSVIDEATYSTELAQMERDYILQYDSFKNGYNCTLPPHNPHLSSYRQLKPKLNF